MSTKQYMVLAFSLVFFQLTLVSKNIRPQGFELQNWYVLSYSIAIVVLLVFWYFTKTSKDILGLSWGKEHKAFAWFSIVSGVLFLAGIALLVYQVQTKGDLTWQTPEHTTNFLIAMMLYQVLLGPILEELIFRGVAQGCLEKAFNPLVAMLLMAAFFIALHDLAIPIVLGALAMGFLRYKTKVIWPCVLIHMAGNAALFFEAYYLK